MSSKIVIALSVAASLLTAAWQAEAQVSPQNAAAAQALFDEGLKLMDAGNAVEACPKLEKSDLLDPGIGTKFQLAQCYEKIGRLAAAWGVFLVAADMAKQQNDTQRTEYLKERAALLAPKLPKLKIVVPPEASVEGLSIRRDGEPVEQLLWNSEVPVDPGTHVVKAEAPGRLPWEQKVESAEGQPVEVTIPSLARLAPQPSATPPAAGVGQPPRPMVTPDVAPAGPRTGLWVAGIAGGVAAVAGFAVDGIFWAKANSDWDEAKRLCTDPEQLKGCRAPADELSQSARDAGVVSAIGFGVGLAGLATMATAGIIALTSGPSSASARRSSVLVVPVVGPNQGAASLRVQF